MKTIPISRRVWLEIDLSDSATPALVVGRLGDDEIHTATWNCAVDTGCLGDNDDLVLDARELAALEALEGEVDAAYASARADDPEYQ